MRVFDVAATCEALHRAPLPGSAAHGLEIEWLSARPKADYSGAVVYAAVRAPLAIGQRQVRVMFMRILQEHGAKNINVYRARRAKDIEDRATALVGLMLGGEP